MTSSQKGFLALLGTLVALAVITFLSREISLEVAQKFLILWGINLLTLITYVVSLHKVIFS